VFPEDALVRIKPEDIRKKGRVPKNASLFFTIFQTFMSGPPKDGKPSEASQATLDVSSTPSGAEIELDGSFVGNTPSTLGVSPGGHTIKVTKNGYATWERKLNTTTGTVRLSPELDPSAPASGK
jgi:hypothetical protein